MAGHSHATNIKYRKDRQDRTRSQLFLKLRKKISTLLQEEGQITRKTLTLARENKFPKEKVYQIWEKIKNEEKNNHSTRAFYQAPFGILVYLENNKNITADLISKLNLKPLPLSSLSSYFQLSYHLKVNSKEKNNALEEYLLTYLPEEIWEKTIYDEEKREFSSANEEEIVKIKKIIEEKKLELAIEGEKVFWKALIPHPLVTNQEIDYYQELERIMASNIFFTNIEKEDN